MGAYIVRRILLALVTIWAVSFFSWVIVQLPPGDYADAYVAIMREWNIKPDWTPEEIDELRDELKAHAEKENEVTRGHSFIVSNFSFIL